MVNHMVLQGRLARDPETRQAGASNVTGFCVAWSEKYGERENKLFLNVNAWGKTGDLVQNYFHKGQEIVVEGRVTQRDYTDKEGNKRTVFEMTADKVHFCGPKQENNGSQGRGFVEVDAPDEELPFL